MMTKQQLAEAILALPDDATVRDALEHLEEIERTESRADPAQTHANGTSTADTMKRRYRPMTKDELAARIADLADDATVDDAIERLQFIKLIEERIAYADAHPEARIPQAEAKRRFAQWLP